MIYVSKVVTHVMPACKCGHDFMTRRGMSINAGVSHTICGCVIHYILENIGPDGGIRDFSEGELKEMLTFANAGASLITTRKGALRVMPHKEEIEALIEEKAKG